MKASLYRGIPVLKIHIFINLKNASLKLPFFPEEGKRIIEMERYKLDLVELRNMIYNKSKNSLDYNRLR